MALRLLEDIRETQDFRMLDIAKQANEASQNYELELANWKQKLAELEQYAFQNFEQHEYRQVVQTLSAIPRGLLSGKLQDLLAKSTELKDAVKRAKAEVKCAVANKDWPEAMSALAELIPLCPHKPKYRDLSKQVSSKLYAQANLLYEKRDFAEALVLMSHIPAQLQTEEHIRLQGQLEEVVFLRRTVAKAPFAAPIVAGVIQRLQKLTPGDARVEQLAAKYTRVKCSRPLLPQWMWSPWMTPDSGLFKDSIAPATLPHWVPGSRPECLVKSGSQFWGAFGLALHGLGYADPSANFLNYGKNKGVLGLLARKKSARPERVWGADFGDCALKAICLSHQDNTVRIEHAVSIPIEAKDATRRELRKADAVAVIRAVEKLSEQVKGDEVVGNVPSSEVFTRYMLLPTDKEKMHDTFIEQEAAANIPISLELLSRSSMKFPAAKAGLTQNAVVLAIRKSEIESRLAIFKRYQMNLISLVAEPLALCSAAEYFKLLNSDSSEKSNMDSAALIVDVGHVRTNILVAKTFGIWSRTLDWGLDNLAQALSSEFKIGRSDADAWRRNPTCAPAIQKTLDVLRNACLVPRRELERSLRAAKETLGDFQIDQPLLIGGGAYQALLGSWLNGEEI